MALLSLLLSAPIFLQCPPPVPAPETCEAAAAPNPDRCPSMSQGDPARVGQFGSNSEVLGQQAGVDSASAPKAGMINTPWSYWMNRAHPLMRDYFITDPCEYCTGLGRQSFGETQIDGYPFNWSVAAPTALFRCESTTTWTIGPYTYRRINATLPSGAHVTVFAPSERTPPNAHYRGDLLLHLAPYQGGAYGVQRNPVTWRGTWNPTSPVATGYPYDPAGPAQMFGVEIEIPSGPSANPYFNLSPRIGWFGPGMIEYEALEMGMTLAVYQESLGARPTLATLSQLVEFAAWVDGPDGPDGSTRPPEPYRKFVVGGSVNGFHAVLAATYMPHVFRGAVGIAPFIDYRRRWDWITCHYRLQEQLLGFYLGGDVKTYEYTSPEWTQFIDLLRGYTPLGVDGLGNPQTGIAGTPVDLAGLGPFASELPGWLSGQYISDDLIVPLVLVHGDDDPSQYNFLDRALHEGQGAPHPAPHDGYTGKIIDLRIPELGHGDTGSLNRWNRCQQVLQKLVQEVNAQPQAPIVHDSALDWSVRAPGQPQLSKQLQTTFLTRPPVGDVDVVNSQYVGKFTASHVETPGWKALRVHEGLGVSGKIVVANVDGDPNVEVVAGTPIGDLVTLDIVTSTLPYHLEESIEPMRIGDLYGAVEVVSTPHTSPTLVMVAHSAGKLSLCDVSSTTPGVKATADLQSSVGFLRGLTRLGVSSDYAVMTDEGHLILPQSQGTPQLTVPPKAEWKFVEGRPGPMVFEADRDLVYASYHGNIKRTTEAADYAHPRDTADLSPHLYASFEHLLPLQEFAPDPTDTGRVGRYLALTGGRAVVLDAALRPIDPIPPPPSDSATRSAEIALLKVGKQSGAAGPDLGLGGRSADGYLVVDETDEHVDLVGFNMGGQEAASKSVVELIRLRRGSQEAEGLAWVILPGPVTALAPFPGNPMLEFPGGTLQAGWVATMQSGQVALIANLGGESWGDRTGTHTIVLGEPWGHAFGIVDIHAEEPGRFVAVGQQGRVWKIKATEDAAPVQPSNLENANKLDPSHSHVHHPARGAIRVDSGGAKVIWGLADGGAAHPGSNYVALPFTYEDEDDVYYDINHSFAGFEVREVVHHDLPNEVDPAPIWWSPHWTPGDPSPVLPPDPETVGCPGPTQAERRALTGRHISVLSVGKPWHAPFTLREFGNSCAWGDIDGNGSFDLVGGTHGGRVMWWSNSVAGSSPPILDPSGAITGELLTDPTVHGEAWEQGWAGDLGSQIIAMTTGRLDDGPSDQIVIGTGYDAAYAQGLPEHFDTTGSVYVLAKGSGNDLVVRDRATIGHGVYGVAHFEIAMSGTTDDYIVAGTADGRLHLFHYDPTATPKLLEVLTTKSLAPMAGAYNSIAVYTMPLPNPSVRRRRIVCSTAGGIYAVDVTLPRPFIR